MYSLSNYKHHIISDLFRIYESYDIEYFVNAFRKDQYVIEDMFNLLIDHEMISKQYGIKSEPMQKQKKCDSCSLGEMHFNSHICIVKS